MKKYNIYVVGRSIGYPSWIKDYELVNNINDADIVFFTGGEDVTPSYYGMEKHPYTWNNPSRDAVEKEIFDSIPSDKFVLGVCRGSQFLCAMNGGILVQDCDNHALGGTHSIINKNGDKYQITSTHHQMQCPYWMNKDYYDILYWSEKNRCTHYDGYCEDGDLNSNWKEEWVEPEIVYYHVPGKPRCLAIQGHPEMMDEKMPVINMLNNLLDSLV